MTPRGALLDALLADPGLAAEVPRGEAVELIVRLAAVSKALELLSVQAPALAPLSSSNGDSAALLTVEVVMELTGLSRRGVYQRSRRPDWRPFAVREGRKTLHFKPGLRMLYAKGS